MATLQIVRSHGLHHNVPVSYDIIDGTAQAGIKFTPSRGSILFRSGEASKNISIPIINDPDAGNHFTWFTVELSLIAGIPNTALGRQASCLVKIYDFNNSNALVETTFNLSSGSTVDAEAFQGWTFQESAGGFIDIHGLSAVDQAVGGKEYNETCDLASSLEPCKDSCTFGGDYYDTQGVDEGVLLLNHSNFVALPTTVRSFVTQAFTISFWIKSSYTEQPGTILSYQLEGSLLSEISLHDHRNLILVINGKITSRRTLGLRTMVNLADGKWNFCAITWSSAGGEVQVYKNGQLVFDGGPYQADYTIQSKGSLVLGQTQIDPCLSDSETCNFEQHRGFVGQLQGLRIWSTVRSASNIFKEMRRSFNSNQAALKLYWRFVPNSLDANGCVANLAPTGTELIACMRGATIVEGSPSSHPRYPCGQVHTNMFYFRAPDAFSQAVSQCYNGRLQFRMFSASHNGASRTGRGFVKLVSPSVTISNGLPGFPLPHQNAGWRPFSVVFREDHGWVREPDGTSITGAEFRAILANATSLLIRGDHYYYSKSGYGQETTYLNDIRLYKSL